MKIRKRIFDIIQIGNKEDVPSFVFDIIIVIMIILNIVCMFLETFQELSGYMQVFRKVEFITMIFFCVEYLLRIWTADYLYPESGKVKSRLRFLISYDGIVDLLTILPFFYLTGFIAFRMLRVVRIFHLFRINAQYDSFNIITHVIYEKRNHIFSSMFIILILMMASSLGMYSVEHEVQPDVFENAFSGIWWSVSTVLTVGYGDIYPITVLGRILAIITAFLGVGVVAIPTGIISAGFVEQYSVRSSSEVKFQDVKEIGEIVIDEKHPFCGKRIGIIKKEFNAKIMLVLRDELSILPTDELVVKENDVIFLKSELLQKSDEKDGKSRKQRKK